MSVQSVTDSTVWIRPEASFSQESSQVIGDVQAPGGDQNASRSVFHHHRGGIGHALMQTLKQLLLSLPSDTSGENAKEPSSDLDQNGAESRASALRADMHNFMHALFQAIRSQEPNSISGASAYSGGFEGQKFDQGLSSLISLMTSGSTASNDQISDLEASFDTLIADLRNGSTQGLSTQQTQNVTLQDFLTKLQQNLLDSPQHVSVTGNVVDLQG